MRTGLESSPDPSRPDLIFPTPHLKLSSIIGAKLHGQKDVGQKDGCNFKKAAIFLPTIFLPQKSLPPERRIAAACSDSLASLCSGPLNSISHKACPQRNATVVATQGCRLFQFDGSKERSGRDWSRLESRPTSYLSFAAWASTSRRVFSRNSFDSPPIRNSPSIVPMTIGVRR